jgi:hypothetical protein
MTPSVYLDVGVSVKPNATKLITFKADDGSITASVEGAYMDGNSLSNVTIVGLATAPASLAVTLNGDNVGNGVYNATSQTFFIGNLESATLSGAWAKDWTLDYGASSGGYGFGGGAIVEWWFGGY